MARHDQSRLACVGWRSSDLPRPTAIAPRHPIRVARLGSWLKARAKSSGAVQRARTEGRNSMAIEQIQRKSRVREKTMQNAPRTRAGVTKKDQKAELIYKKNAQAPCRRKKRFFSDDR